MDEAETAAAGRRARAVAVLRAVADLIEARPDLPALKGSLTFYVHSKYPDVPAGLRDIVAAIPGQWNTATHDSGDYSWLDFDLVSGCGLDVKVSARTEDACIPSGTRTVTTWEPLPEIAALADGGVEQE